MSDKGPIVSRKDLDAAPTPTGVPGIILLASGCCQVPLVRLSYDQRDGTLTAVCPNCNSPITRIAVARTSSDSGLVLLN